MSDRQTSGGIIANIKEILRRIKVHNVAVSSAGIAFYGLLALVPALVALVSIYSLVADPSSIQDQVTESAGSLDGTTQAFLTKQLGDIVGQVEDAENRETGLIAKWSALIVSILLALFSASGAVQKLMNTISLAYDAEEKRPGWKVRGLAYGFTTVAIAGVATMILAIGIVPAILDRVDMGGVAEAAIAILQLPALGILFAITLTVFYRYSPDRQTRTPWQNPGALVATLLFVLFTIAFSVYSSNVGELPSAYGLLGSIAALMIFLQLMALAVIVGAEVNGATENRAAVPIQTKQVPASANGRDDTNGTEDPQPQPSTLSFGKALAGLAALFALDRATSKR